MAGTEGICNRCPSGQQPNDDHTECVDETFQGLTELQWIIVGIVLGLPCLGGGAAAAFQTVPFYVKLLDSLFGSDKVGNFKVGPMQPFKKHYYQCTCVERNHLCRIDKKNPVDGDKRCRECAEADNQWNAEGPKTQKDAEGPKTQNDTRV